MGYWEQDSNGAPFATDDDVTRDEQMMYWGDQPADIIGNALFDIKVSFLRDLGRLPSVAEIIAGIKFSTKVLDDELPARPEDSKRITPEQQAVIDKHGWTATGGDVGRTLRQIEAARKINEVLSELGAR